MPPARILDHPLVLATGSCRTHTSGMSPLTIVRAMPFFDPATQFGGVISQSREISRRLAERGHRVLVVTTDNGQGTDTPRDTWVEKDGYQVYYASTSPRHRLVPYWTPTMAKPLAEVLPSADVLQLNVGLTLTNALGRRLARRFGVPYVYNAEGALCPVRLGLKRWSKKLFLALFERRVLRDAAAVQALTSKDVEDLVRQGAPRERVHLIPNGVDPFEPTTPQLESPRSRLGIPADAPLVLFLGRIHQIKGLDLLLAGIAGVTGVEPWLLVVGPDEDDSRATLETQARSLGIGERVVFAGPQNGPDKDAIYATADLFALTSYTEGLPMAVLEACSHSLPCLLTIPCNVPEVAQHGAGRVVACDSAEIASALGEMLADSSSLKAMGDSACKLVREQFSLERVVNELSSLYRSLHDAKV